MPPQFSIIVPVYNRPDEVRELLESCCLQDGADWELIFVEDGSQHSSESIVHGFLEQLPVRYFRQDNAGPGPARNTGASLARGEMFVFLDSDCLLPEGYMERVRSALKANPVDAFGGPDRAHRDFSNLQKAINYAMTSFFTTGGIRGAKKSMDTFYPRSFNMGISAEAFRACKGFSEMRFGEDLDFSMRLVERGYKTALFPEAWVYHKRRTHLRSFFKQVYNSGMARIHLHLRHPGTLKWVHLLPSAFLIFSLLCVLSGVLLGVFGFWKFALLCALACIPFPLVIFLDGLRQTREFNVALLAIPASYTQLMGYGTGLLHAAWGRYVRRKAEFSAFRKRFYS
jgi:glycosyltransferase involved in cell wall biosynthesis